MNFSDDTFEQKKNTDVTLYRRKRTEQFNESVSLTWKRCIRKRALILAKNSKQKTNKNKNKLYRNVYVTIVMKETTSKIKRKLSQIEPLTIPTYTHTPIL